MELDRGYRKLQNLYSPSSITETGKNAMGIACSMHEVNSNACSIFVGMPEGKRPLASRRRRWMDNIKMYLSEAI
jgi:hypothetical protein